MNPDHDSRDEVLKSSRLVAPEFGPLVERGMMDMTDLCSSVVNTGGTDYFGQVENTVDQVRTQHQRSMNKIGLFEPPKRLLT